MTADVSNGNTTATYYLPHLGVLREDSRSTKLRVVFNASSRTNNGYSLNDILHAGSKLQTDIAEVLLWTCTHRIMFTTDIEKMFKMFKGQIAVHQGDQDLQRILWYDHEGRLISYRLTTVTYGLNCAPFLALRTIEQLIIGRRPPIPQSNRSFNQRKVC